MNVHNYHLSEQEIPPGFHIYEERLQVAGANFRKEDTGAFASSKDGWLEFQQDPDNKYDRKAIKVIGCNKGFFGTKRRFIGYVPKEVAHRIIDGDFLSHIVPILLKTYIGYDDYVEILFQILGPKEKKAEFLKTSTDPIEQINGYVLQKDYNQAITLLVTLIASEEKRAKKTREGVAPWFYERLAVIYRKQKQYEDEVAILERFERQTETIGALRGKLADRLIKARQLRDKSKGKTTK